MKSIRNHAGIIFIVFACCLAAGFGAQKDHIRPPAVAGQFYPSEPARLKLAIRDFLKDAAPARVEKPVAIVVPHAGYIYAGQICADGYHQVQGRDYDIVAILGTNHTTAGFHKISVYSQGAFRTPLGDAPIDEEAAARLLAEDRDCTSDTEVHAHEHSVEVQVPFVQVLFPKARILPVIVSGSDPDMWRRFGRKLAEVLKGRRALIVASSDLSHFPAYEDALRVDRQTLEAIAKMDPAGFITTVSSLMSRGTRNLDTCACGEGAILATMAAASALGATHGVAVGYANTGDVIMGSNSRVVGYGAVVFAAGEGRTDTSALDRPDAPGPTPLKSSEKKDLLVFARKTLELALTSGTIPLALRLEPRLQTRQGAFVTLKKHGRLRGCIGHMTAESPLGQTVGVMAIQAALNDPRFSRVTPSELPDLEIEISVLTPMKRVGKATDIVVGRDGVMMKKDGRSAVFLPQVATEMHWNYKELLSNLSEKAGLPADSWKKGAEFFVFQAEVFRESEFR